MSIITNCQTFRSTEYSVFLSLASKILLGALIAFFMEVTEVMVVTYTSSLTLSIAGIFKVRFLRYSYNIVTRLFSGNIHVNSSGYLEW